MEKSGQENLLNLIMSYTFDTMLIFVMLHAKIEIQIILFIKNIQFLNTYRCFLAIFALCRKLDFNFVILSKSVESKTLSIFRSPRTILSTAYSTSHV